MTQLYVVQRPGRRLEIVGDGRVHWSCAYAEGNDSAYLALAHAEQTLALMCSADLAYKRDRRAADALHTFLPAVHAPVADTSLD